MTNMGHRLRVARIAFAVFALVAVLLTAPASSRAADRAERLLDKDIAARFSPRAYRRSPVAKAKLDAIFLAAHAAASAYGERPWRYLVATRREHPDAYEKLFSTLNEKNQAWVQRRPPVLILALYKQDYVNPKRPGPNTHAAHDLGMADATLALQAQKLGVSLRHTSGFDAAKAKALFAIPAGYEASSVIVLGYAASPRVLPAERRRKEQARRSRAPYANPPTLAETTFFGSWGRRGGEAVPKSP